MPDQDIIFRKECDILRESCAVNRASKWTSFTGIIVTVLVVVTGGMLAWINNMTEKTAIIQNQQNTNTAAIDVLKIEIREINMGIGRMREDLAKNRTILERIDAKR